MTTAPTAMTRNLAESLHTRMPHTGTLRRAAEVTGAGALMAVSTKACRAVSARPALHLSFATQASAVLARRESRPRARRRSPRCEAPCRRCSAAGSKVVLNQRNWTRRATPMGPSDNYPSNQLDWLLDDLVLRVPHIQRAVYLSQDGLAPGASRSPDRAAADHLAARPPGVPS